MATWTPGARVLSHPGANWAQSRCSIYMLIDFYHFLGATAGQPYRTECRRLLMGEPRQSPKDPESPQLCPDSPTLLLAQASTSLASPLSTPAASGHLQPGP